MQMVKCVLSGTISGTQTWSTGMWLDTSGATWTQDDLNDANAQWAGYFASATGSYVSTLFGSTTKVLALTSYLFAPGAIVSSLISVEAAVTGNGSGDSLPSLCSIVVSTRSQIPGRSGRGRNYLPCTKVGALDGTGQLADTTCGTVATGWAGIMTNINSHTVNGINPVVAVRSTFKGTSYAISRVVVNSLVDVQHRREDSVPTTTDVSHDVA